MFENRESKLPIFTQSTERFRSSNRATTSAQSQSGELLEDRRLLTDLFVAMDGDDTNSGAMDAPFATLAAAIQAADPGDVINLREGTYVGNVTIDEPNITVQGLRGCTRDRAEFRVCRRRSVGHFASEWKATAAA